MRITMKRIDFENGTVTENILSAALPMLAAQILSLLYNIVDRIYIGKIPGEGTLALASIAWCCRTLFSAYYDHHGLQQSVRERRRTAFFDQPWKR